MIDPSTVPAARVAWAGARRIIRSRFPPIDLFDDIADPEDWPALLSAEQKSNPRLMESLGALDLIPRERWASGPGASYLMAPFTQVSPDRPSRFSDGRHGVLYAARHFETALMETIHHHQRFMAATREPPGWTSQFRELAIDVRAALHDLRKGKSAHDAALDPEDYRSGQALGAALRSGGSNGVVYPSVRHRGGQCAALFYPDLARNVVQGRHLDYHWNGERVDLYRDVSAGAVFRVG